MHKLKLIILTIVAIPAILLGKSDCNDGINLYYQGEFINSSVTLEKCIKDSSSTKTEISDASLYIARMILENKISLKGNNLQYYLEKIIKIESNQINYILGLLYGLEYKYKEASLAYLTIIEPMMLVGKLKDKKAPPLDIQSIIVNSMITNKKGESQNISIAVQSIENQNITKVKYQIIKTFLAYSYEKLLKKDIIKDIEEDINLFSGNLNIVKYTINGTTINNDNLIKLKSYNNLLELYKIGNIYHSKQFYQQANFYFNLISKILIYQEVYGQDTIYTKNIDKKEKINYKSIDISSEITDAHHRKYMINLTISIRGDISNDIIKNEIQQMLKQRSTEELLTVGGIAMLKEDIDVKLKSDIFIISYSLSKNRIVVNDKVVKY